MKWITPSRKALSLILGAALAAPALGVGTSNWTQTNEADWKDGTFDNVVTTNLGDLKLSRAVKTLLEQDPRVSSVNALAQGPDGTVYAGTGPRGVLLRVKGDAVDEVARIDDAQIFSVLVDAKGQVLLGTGGTHGRVLRIVRPGEKPQEIFKAEGVQYVWAIRQTADGNLYAATGPDGQLFEIKPDGSQRVVLDTDENNLLTLVSDGKDLLYAGTDPNGLVYRVNRKTGESFILYDAAETEVSALALDARGNLYAGTAEAREDQAAVPTTGAAEQVGRPEGGTPGAPLPSERPNDPEPPKVPDPTPGQPEPIPKVSRSVGSGAVGLPAEAGKPAGIRSGAVPTLALNVGTVALQQAPDGPGGDPTPAPNPPTPGPGPGPGPSPNPNPNPPGGEKPGPGASLPGAEANVPGRQPAVDTRATGQPRPEGNAVYRIDPGGFVTEIFRHPVLVLAIVERQGTLLIATGSPTEGQIYQLRPAAEETIVLAKVNPKQVLSLLPTADGGLYMGLANVGGIAMLSPGFAAEGKYTSPVLDAQQVSRFGNVQLHGLLPEGSALKVSTRSGNVRDSAQKTWSSWSEEMPATEFVKITSPPARFLQYRLTFAAAEGGKSSPVVEDVSVSYQMPNLPPQIKTVRIVAAPDAAAATPPGEADAPRIPSARKQVIAWEAADANNDAMQYALHFRRGSGSSWILLKDKLREAQFEWDTRSVADGRYEVKVVATDAAANPPGEGRTTSRVSDPVLVDNTPPAIGDLRWQQKGADVELKLTAVDRTSVVAAMDYAVDSSRDWQAVLPSDKIFDGPQEDVAFSVGGLSPGTHQLTLRATDAKGNQAFENVVVTVEPPAAKR
jgi:hypothetical protein